MRQTRVRLVSEVPAAHRWPRATGARSFSGDASGIDTQELIVPVSCVASSPQLQAVVVCQRTFLCQEDRSSCRNPS